VDQLFHIGHVADGRFVEHVCVRRLGRAGDVVALTLTVRSPLDASSSPPDSVAIWLLDEVAQAQTLQQLQDTVGME
jgi:hypothetical protein